MFYSYPQRKQPKRFPYTYPLSQNPNRLMKLQYSCNHLSKTIYHKRGWKKKKKRESKKMNKCPHENNGYLDARLSIKKREKKRIQS